jgi:hypothetical protein
VQPGATASTYGRFDTARPATSPGNLASEAAAQYPISPYGYREGYALPQPGYGGNNIQGNFSTTGQAEELPSGLGGSRTTSALQGAGGQNYLATGMTGGAGGFLRSPEDVSFFLDMGILTPEQAALLKQVGEKNEAAGKKDVQSLGSYAPSSGDYDVNAAYRRRFQG